MTSAMLSFQRGAHGQSGMVIFSLLIALPACFGILFGAVHLSKQLIDLEGAQKECIEKGMKLQHAVGRSVSQLLKLNPMATSLRRQRDRADRKLVLAMATQQPAAIAVALQNLRQVIARQMMFRARQEAIKAKATADEKAWRLEVLQSPILDRKTSRSMAVIKIPSYSLTPDYHLEASFEEKQKASTNWKVKKFKGHCEVTLSQNLVPKILKTSGG